MEYGELYDKVAKLLLQGVDIDQAVQQGLFEAEDIPVVYEILDRRPRKQITFDGNKPDYKWNMEVVGGD